MSTQFFPLEGCLTTATAIKTAMAASVAHLFQSSLAPDPSTPTSDYTAAEGNFDGYADVTITAWNAPILAPGTGYLISTPLLTWAWTHVSMDVGNLIGGAYILDAASKNRLVVIFDEVIPMQMAGQGIQFYVNWLFPTGV